MIIFTWEKIVVVTKSISKAKKNVFFSSENDICIIQEEYKVRFSLFISHKFRLTQNINVKEEDDDSTFIFTTSFYARR